VSKEHRKGSWRTEEKENITVEGAKLEGVIGWVEEEERKQMCPCTWKGIAL